MKKTRFGVAGLALLAVAGCGGGAGDGLTGTPGPVPDAIVALDPGFTIKNPSAGSTYLLNPGNVAPQGGRPAGAYTFTLASGSAFPGGTTVDSDTGIFHATGAVTGTSGSFDLDISDGHGTVTETFTYTASSCNSGGISNACLAMCWGLGLGTALPDGAVGKPYGAALGVKIGSSGQSCEAALPLTWALDGSGGPLPPGLSLDTVHGVISGTPTMAGTYQFTVLVQDHNGASPTNAAPVESITVN